MVPGTTVEEPVLSAWNGLGTPVSPSSVPLVSVSVLTALPHCAAYGSFMVSFEIRKCKSFDLIILQISFLSLSGLPCNSV